MINALEIGSFLGYSAGSIESNGSSSSYSIELKNVYKILWVEEGSVKVTFKGFNVLLNKNECLFIDKDTSLIFNSMGDFKLSYIQIMSTQISKNIELNLLINNSKLFDSNKVINKINIKDEYVTVSKHYIKILWALQHKEQTSLNILLAHNTLQQIILFSMATLSNLDSNGASFRKDYTNEKLLNSFNDLVLKNIQNERNVKFYCDKVGVDYNVLNKVCLSEYGINVKSYLDLKCLYQIKCKLESSSLSLKEISEYFNFSDTSNFLRFFKRLTEMTVSEYRNKVTECSTRPNYELNAS